MKTIIKTGVPFIWLTAASTAVAVLLVFGLLLLICVKGLGFFWAKSVYSIQYLDSNNEQVRFYGELAQKESYLKAEQKMFRMLFKIGNRDLYGQEFLWLEQDRIVNMQKQSDIATVERIEWGNLYGVPKQITVAGKVSQASDSDFNEQMHLALSRNKKLQKEIRNVENKRIGHINYQVEKLRLRERAIELKKKKIVESMEPSFSVEHKKIQKRHEALQSEYAVALVELEKLQAKAKQDMLVVEISDGTLVTLTADKIVDLFYSNDLSFLQKLFFYLERVFSFLADDPREANTEGGVFPAIYGTVLMVMVMVFFVTPFGVIAAVYLHEYAKQNLLTKMVRVAVKNLAGVPSVVYGIFGLGFFIYFLGGEIDKLFFSTALPTPTFGTPGLLWGSLTLALLTLPVVIVSTEEGLARVPRNIRESSLALGASKWETIWHNIIPLSLPAMMTGIILAVARAAGEVAPLLLVGAVKLAPSLPLDGSFPYFHPERKFMHLGFHIYDIGFQSPNAESAIPIVYATAFLLLSIVVALNILAIYVRNHFMDKYRLSE